MSNTTTPELDARIRRVLGALRWRIRAYVWLEGLALAVVWLGLMFWAALAVDYLPILVGASELSRAFRAIVLLIVAVVLGYILYQWVFRRAFVRMADHSMAVLLERRYREFQDALVTSVEMKERPDHATDFSPEMLTHADEQALAAIRGVSVGSVFNTGPLLWKLAGASLLALTILAFGFLQSDALARAAKRLYLLENEPWPRRVQVEVVGIEVLRASLGEGKAPPPQLVEFDEGRIRVARGSSVRLNVRAFAGADDLPETCTILYRTEDGERGRVSMKKIGQMRQVSREETTISRAGDEAVYSQKYVYDGKPFKGVLSTIEFDVIGRDHRASDYRVDVVDSPTIVGAKLNCEFPSYLVNKELDLWLPREIDYRSGVQLPLGTKLTISAEANKELKKVHIYNPEKDETTTIDFPDGKGREFAFEVPSLDGNLTLDVTLHDADNVISERPHRLHISAIPDEPPTVAVRLKGIGMAVTPDVVVPIEGTIQDDYAVARAWVAATVNEANSREFPVSIASAGAVKTEVDFREVRNQDEQFALQPGDKLTLTVQAADKLDLAGGPNIGSGDKYQLDVVTPDALLALLDQREYGLRMRFLQIIDEVTQMRDDLVRVKAEGLADSSAEPGDADSESDAESLNAAEPGDTRLTPEQRAQRLRSLRLLRTQRAQTQSEKSAQEISGVALSFLDIRQELVNNRVDTQDRKDRLKDLVADPLLLIVNNLFPELDSRLKTLEASLDDREAGNVAAEAAIAQANDVLLELEAVLEKMIDIQDFNEIIAEVRALLEAQEKLLEQTKSEQKKSVLQDLFK